MGVNWSDEPAGALSEAARSQAPTGWWFGSATWLEAPIRRGLDLTVAVPVLVLSVPLMLVLALLIRLDSSGPALFRQTRIGQDRRRSPARPEDLLRRKHDLGGRPFTFFKFRTMYADARQRHPELYTYRYDENDLEVLPMKVLMGRKVGHEEFRAGRPSAALFADPRFTPVGRWLRRTSLDELPNLINVLLGDMHLVGPRPDIPDHVSYYDQDGRRKFSVRPGVTGLAQVRGRGLLPFNRMVALDLEYVRTRSIRRDVSVLAETVRSIFRGDGAY